MNRLGGIFWRKIGPEAHTGWNQIAVSLSSLTSVGVFLEVTVGVNDFMRSALLSVSAELTNLSKSFR